MVVEELGRSVAPGPLLATISQFAPMVREAGTPEQRAAVPVRGRLRRDCTGAVALADHPRGWSLDDVTMRAERAEGGWVLEGTKYGVMAGHGVDEIAVVARVGDGVGAFVVPVGRRRAHTGPLARRQPARSHRHRSTGWSSPTTAPSASPAAQTSTRAVARAIEEATAALALETVGACDALFQMVLAYVKDRKQFGVPVGSFQAIKHKMSNMFLAVERARSLCYFAVAAIDGGHARRVPPPSPWPRRPATTASTWCAASRSSRSVASASPGSTTATSS